MRKVVRFLFCAVSHKKKNSPTTFSEPSECAEEWVRSSPLKWLPKIDIIWDHIPPYNRTQNIPLCIASGFFSHFFSLIMSYHFILYSHKKSPCSSCPDGYLVAEHHRFVASSGPPPSRWLSCRTAKCAFRDADIHWTWGVNGGWLVARLRIFQKGNRWSNLSGTWAEYIHTWGNNGKYIQNIGKWWEIYPKHGEMMGNIPKYQAWSWSSGGRTAVEMHV